MEVANYFSHDTNAARDPKILRLRKAHGWAGYGLFWALIEMLRSCKDYSSECDYDALAFDLRTDEDTIKSIIEDFDLFIVEHGMFYSESLCSRMKAKSDMKRKAANRRWNKQNALQSDADAMQSDADVMHVHTDAMQSDADIMHVHADALQSDADAMQNDANKRKGKESKGNKIKGNNNINNITVRVNEILNDDEIWKEAVAMQSGNGKAFMRDFPLHASTFATHLVAQGKIELLTTPSELKSYFANWYRKTNPKTTPHDKSKITDLDSRINAVSG